MHPKLFLNRRHKTPVHFVLWVKGDENMQLQDSSDIRRALELYSPLVYRLAYSRTGSHADAEDVCQEVFMSLVRKNPDFETEENRRAWLIRATMNRAASLWRTPWKKRVALGDDSAQHRSAVRQDEALADALESLSGDDRALIQLHYYEGFKSDEIAAMLGRKPATVRTQLMRARNRLKKQLTEEV